MYFLSASFGGQPLPDFLAVAVLDGVEVGYCDHNDPTPTIKQDWAKELISNHPHVLENHRLFCKVSVSVARILIELLNHQLSHMRGLSI